MNVAEIIAKRFHEEYERLAPKVGWATQEASRVPWEELPKPNRDLMILVVQSLMAEDIIAYVDHTTCETGAPTPQVAAFITCIERSIGRRIDRIGIGPGILLDRDTAVPRERETSRSSALPTGTLKDGESTDQSQTPSRRNELHDLLGGLTCPQTQDAIISSALKLTTGP